MMRLAVITTGHDEDYQFERWLDIYREYKDEIDYHIIVDNNSSQEYFSKIKRNFRSSIIVQLHEDRGIAGGFNAGIRAAEKLNADLVMFAIQDMHLPAGNVTVLKNKFLEDDSIGVISPIIFAEKNSSKIRLYGGRIRSSDFTVIQYDQYSEYSENMPELKRVSFVCGGMFMIKMDLLQKLGLYDENIFMYGDEVDLLLRLRSQNMGKILVTSNAKCWHEHYYRGERSKKFRSPSSEAIYYTCRNYFYLIKKHGGVTNFLFGLARAIVATPKYYYKFAIRERSFRKFKSVIEGYIKGIFFARNHKKK